jgi:hypothetical protein
MDRRCFVRNSALLLGAGLLPLAAAGQAGPGTIHELRGRVLLNGRPMAPDSAVQPGQTITTGSDGHVWFTLGGDAFFLRPGSVLRLGPSVRDNLVDTLRLVAGALGATFRRGGERRVVAQTVTLGIRGTGIYVATDDQATYACTCFGSVELHTARDTATVRADHHAARDVRRTDQRIAEAPMQGHTDEEIARLERLAGRPYPF